MAVLLLSDGGSSTPRVSSVSPREQDMFSGIPSLRAARFCRVWHGRAQISLSRASDPSLVCLQLKPETAKTPPWREDNTPRCDVVSLSLLASHSHTHPTPGQSSQPGQLNGPLVAQTKPPTTWRDLTGPDLAMVLAYTRISELVRSCAGIARELS